jgi:iron complex transport system ATP-binding protein
MRAATRAAVLSLSHVTAAYGSTIVLRDVSVQLHAGELLAIVGPNGAGKSTLLKSAAGLLEPSAGNIELLGRRLTSYARRELARVVAIVPQENQVAFRFTVLEVVLMGRAPHLGSFRLETGRDLAAAQAAMERFELMELSQRPINELSGGERKRVFLARAVAQQARVMLLDEPTAFLDLRHAADILVQFRRLCAQSAVGVAATMHDLNAAASYANRILLLDRGSIVACGSPDEVLTVRNLEQVYGVKVHIDRNPVNGGLAVFLTGPPELSIASNDKQEKERSETEGRK